MSEDAHNSGVPIEPLSAAPPGAGGDAAGETAAAGTPPPSTPPPDMVVNPSFKQLSEALFRQRTVDVTFDDGSPGFRIPVRVLTAAEAELFRLELKRTTPPLKHDAAANRFVADFNDEGWKANARTHEVRARAIAVYLGCPLLQAEKPGLKTPEAITEFVQGALPVEVINTLYWAIVPATDRDVESLTAFF